ncbi:lysis protein [Xenorhabdus sp. Sc-CR9]|uniref:lysis protein n=1 Tax=Xenorhabdus sp. Sc-CR9 TaxID=2584468 RepID=UPI001F1A3520|nr:lysis protein [Xenorhabdus sp. Sc-CR9]
MTWKVKAVGVMVCVALLGWAVQGFYSVYVENGRLIQANATLKQSLSEQIALIAHQQGQLRHLAEQDAKRIQELTHAKSEIARLHTASLAHPERVYIKAKCPVPETTAPAGMADAATARPTDAAVRNYWLLRERIATSEHMMQGLQDYIKTQCR